LGFIEYIIKEYLSRDFSTMSKRKRPAGRASGEVTISRPYLQSATPAPPLIRSQTVQRNNDGKIGSIVHHVDAPEASSSITDELGPWDAAFFDAPVYPTDSESTPVPENHEQVVKEVGFVLWYAMPYLNIAEEEDRD
jgi:hypothetical protein